MYLIHSIYIYICGTLGPLYFIFQSKSCIPIESNPFLSIYEIYQNIIIPLMWAKQCHKPSMTGNGHVSLKIVTAGGWFMKLGYPHDCSMGTTCIALCKIHT